MLTGKKPGRLVKLVHLSFENGRNRFFRQYDVTSSQMDLLDYLDQKEQKAASQKEIVEYLQMSYATVSGLIKRLETKGYLCRGSFDKDKRANLIMLTSQTGQLFETCSEHMDARDEHLMRDFTQEEKEQFVYLLEKILKNSGMDLPDDAGKRFVPSHRIRFHEDREGE